MAGSLKLKNVVGPQVRRFREQHGWSQSVLAAISVRVRSGTTLPRKSSFPVSENSRACCLTPA